MSVKKLEQTEISLAKGFDLYIISPQKAIVIGEKNHFIISGEDQVAVLELINQSFSESQILMELGSRLGELKVLSILDHFFYNQICCRQVLSASRSYEDVKFCENANTFADYHSFSIEFLDDGEYNCIVENTFEEEGLFCLQPKVNATSKLRIIITNNITHSQLKSINLTQKETNSPWILISLEGPNPMIIPFFNPLENPCYQCFMFWYKTNRPVEQYILKKTGIKVSQKGIANYLVVRTLAEQASFFIKNFLLGTKETAFDLMSIDAESMDCSLHTLLKRPQCSCCGDSKYMKNQGFDAIQLENKKKGFVEDGGARLQDPKTTFRQFNHLISPLIGPVSQFGPMPKRHTADRPVFLSGYRTCPILDDINAYSFQRICAGKGCSIEQAQVSALFEAVERFSSLYQGDEAIVKGSLLDMGPSAFHPNDLQLFSEKQLDSWTPECLEKLGALKIAKRYNEDESLHWTPGWSLTYNCRRFIPFSYCYSDAASHINSSYACFTGNGVAAGVCLEEAILQGFFELVERDAVAIWWYNQIQRPTPNAEVLDNSFYKKTKEEYQRAGWDMWVLDLTHDLSIPVYAALAQSKKSGRFSIGFGCHLSSKLALFRALTELNQLFDPEGDHKTPWDEKAMLSNDYLFPKGESERPREYPLTQTGLLEDIQECLHLLNLADLEMVVVNKSRPDTGVKVAHVIVPGLRHFWPRFGKGRLYDVPLKLGWLKKSLSELSLNPVPLLV